MKKVLELFFILIFFQSGFVYSSISDLAMYDPLEDRDSPRTILNLSKLSNKEWLLKTIKELNQFLKYNPENHRAYTIRGLYVYFLTTLETNKSKQYEYLRLGQEYCKEALRKFPHSAFIQMTYISFTAQIYLLQGIPHVLKNAEQIARAMHALIEKDPGCCYGRAAFFLGRLYYKLPGFPISRGSLEKSKKYLEMAIRHNPDLLAAYISLADTEYALGNKKKALQILEEAVELKPKIWLDYYNFIYFYPGIEIMKKAMSEDQWTMDDDIFLILKKRRYKF